MAKLPESEKFIGEGANPKHLNKERKKLFKKIFKGVKK